MTHDIITYQHNINMCNNYLIYCKSLLYPWYHISTWNMNEQNPMSWCYTWHHGDTPCVKLVSWVKGHCIVYDMNIPIVCDKGILSRIFVKHMNVKSYATMQSLISCNHLDYTHAISPHWLVEWKCLPFVHAYIDIVISQTYSTNVTRQVTPKTFNLLPRICTLDEICTMCESVLHLVDAHFENGKIMEGNV